MIASPNSQAQNKGQKHESLILDAVKPQSFHHHPTIIFFVGGKKNPQSEQHLSLLISLQAISTLY